MEPTPKVTKAPTRGNYRHGGTTQHGKSPEYVTWSQMHDRCRNPHNKRYARYGGRGITVCERWSDFGKFKDDMGLRPLPEYTIERIDNDGDYEPGNCRWATREEQAANQSHTRLLTAFGKTLSMSGWECAMGINRTTIRSRIDRGMTAEDAIRLGSRAKAPIPDDLNVRQYPAAPDA